MTAKKRKRTSRAGNSLRKTKICRQCRKKYKGWGVFYCSQECKNISTEWRHKKKKKCKNCEKWFSDLPARELCMTCYRKENSVICVSCKKLKPRIAKGLCQSCYNREAGYTAPHRIVLVKSDKEKKCFACDERRIPMLDVHHLDKNHSNNSIENLAWACPNHHRMVHLGLI